MNYETNKFTRLTRNAPLVAFSHAVVWLWKDAPPWAKERSEHGGDEECVVWIPASLQTGEGTFPAQLEALWRPYGDADFYQYDNGMLVIWSH